MRSIFENSEVFTAYATVDAGYYLLRQYQEHLSKPQSPIEKMIDEATGYGMERVRRERKEIAEILKDIIKAKKFIEADYSKDEEMLNKLTK
ncbi:MAG: hypothetical protein V4538_14995 [Bacteroidota bacterium]